MKVMPILAIILRTSLKSFFLGGKFNEVLWKKKKKKTQKFKEIVDSRHINQNEVDEACFPHDMAHWNFKYLTRRTGSDKVLRDKACNIAKNSKCDGYQRGLTSMVYNFSW